MPEKRPRVVFKPEGNMVSSSIQDSAERLEHLMSPLPKELIVDLEGVEVIDSTGLSLLIGAHLSVTRAGGSLKVVNCNKEILELFKSMRLQRHFSLERGEEGDRD